ncbi:MAG: ADP-ribosylglycohydrolase family protein [Opitutales bacterium]
MIGAIAGDIIGSPYEGFPIRRTDFPLFIAESRPTDDSVLTVATAEALVRGKEYSVLYRDYFRSYPNAGYGGSFIRWGLGEVDSPYNSFGNGSAMRVSPVGWARETLGEVLNEARRSAAVTHNHPEGIRGAQAVAGALFLARKGKQESEIRAWLSDAIGYRMDRTVDQIRPTYRFDITCQGSVPEALTCALEANSFEEALRLAVSLGGDADTQACIAGSVAEARFGVPGDIATEALKRLPQPLREVVDLFQRSFRTG